MELTKNIELSCLECCECHVLFAVTKQHKKQLVETGEDFCCPVGHTQHFSRAQIPILKKEIEQLSRLLRYERRRNIYNKRTVAAYKGHYTRLKNKMQEERES